jgi:hypothetical protein
MKIDKCKTMGSDGIQITTGTMVMEIVTQFGPRIASLRRNVRGAGNLLFWDPKERFNRFGWFLHGGHRVWATQSTTADETETTYKSDNRHCTVEMCRLVSSPWVEIMGDPLSGVQRGIRVVDLNNGSVSVINIVRNTSKQMFLSAGVWALTCVDPRGKEFCVPLGCGNDDWDRYTVVPFNRLTGFETAGIADSQFVWRRGLLNVSWYGNRNKIMLEVPRGWMACHAPQQKASFFKMFSYDRHAMGSHPMGCNVAVFTGPRSGPRMVEMETLGPVRNLLPGESAEHEETWVLTDPVRIRNLDDIERVEEILGDHED